MRPMPLALGLALLLAACSLTLTLPLPDQTFSLPPDLPTEEVLYPSDPVAGFQPPPGLKGVRLEGTLVAERPLQATLGFYLRLRDPQEDPGCRPLPGGYACPSPQEAKVGEAVFAGTSTAPLVLEGPGLIQGVREGRFWLGLQVRGPLAAGTQVTLRELRARVVVGL